MPTAACDAPQAKNKLNMDQTRPKQKSVLVTYFLWLFGGIFGLHHLYLHRDRHAFVWWCTLGGYFGIGWICEIFHIPEMVRDANEDPRFIEKFVRRLKKHPKPPFSTKRFMGQILVGYLYGSLFQMAIPEELIGGIDWSFLHWLIPLFASLGVWLVGNVGREKGVFWHCLVMAYIVYPLRYYLYDETYWLTATVFAAALAFDTFSKNWRREPPKRHSTMRRILYLALAASLYLSLWGGFLYFNGKITDSDGDEVPVHEAVRNFLSSPFWKDFKQSLYDMWVYAQHNGWYETWKIMFDSMDMDGEKNAYQVLGLSATASQTEITATWRRLSKENHPDKVKDETKRRAAQERFMDIQQAYEVLSKIKSKRRQRNKKFNDDL